MRALLLTLCLLLLLSGCSAVVIDPPTEIPEKPEPVERAPEVFESDAAVEQVEPSVQVETAPVVVETAETVEPVEETPDAEPVLETPEAPQEGDIDSDTLAQIGALEQNSSVRNDDHAPVEASAYCTLTVTAEALLERRDALTDVMLPPDGVFYSGALVLTGDETALALICATLDGCGLGCELDDENNIVTAASIAADLQEDMSWVVRCNGTVLELPAEHLLQSGDALVLSYE